MVHRKTESLPEFSAHDVSDEIGSDRSFGVVFTVVFALLAVYLYVSPGPSWTPDIVHQSALWPIRHLIVGSISVMFLTVALVVPAWLHPLNVVWMKGAAVLQRIVSPVVLGLLFFVAFVPLGLFFRITGRDLLRLKWDMDASSYWIERTPGPAPETMKNQF